jgi:hypothetical protein
MVPTVTLAELDQVIAAGAVFLDVREPDGSSRCAAAGPGPSG